MTMLATLVGALFIGQCDCYPIYASVVTVPVVSVASPESTVVFYKRTGDPEISRFDAEIIYENKFVRTVPIINNIAPVFTTGYLPDGRKYVIYNYTYRIPYESVNTPDRQLRKVRQWEQAKIDQERARQAEREQWHAAPLEPVGQPVLQPIPQAESPRPMPVPTAAVPVIVVPRHDGYKSPSEVGPTDRVIGPSY